MSILKKMRLRKIRRIKEDFKKVSFPQSFCRKNYFFTNCMAYAIGAKVPDYTFTFYFPGGISGNKHILFRDTLVEKFINDMEQIGIHAEVITSKQAKRENQDGIQTMVLYYSAVQDDFHCIRKDKDGGWSHKVGYEGIPEKVDYNYEEVIELSYELIAFFNLSFL